MTDPALTFGTTLAMAGFWTARCRSGILAADGGLRILLGLAVGLLAKGPVAAILVLMPIGSVDAVDAAMARRYGRDYPG